MPIKPRQIDDAGLFTNDWRDSSKFWWLNAPIQPIMNVGLGGRFIRPGMIEDELGNSPGNAAIAAFPDAFVDGQVWELDHVGFFNGGAAAKLVGMQIAYDAGNIFLGSDAAVGILAPQQFLSSPITIDDQIGIQVIVGGAAADVFSVHARRVA